MKMTMMEWDMTLMWLGGFFIGLGAGCVIASALWSWSWSEK